MSTTLRIGDLDFIGDTFGHGVGDTAVRVVVRNKDWQHGTSSCGVVYLTDDAWLSLANSAGMVATEKKRVESLRALFDERDALKRALKEACDIALDERWTSRDPKVREAQKARIAALQKEHL
ncbi:MAG: hypothetical protein HOV80_36180 [Polyangiaceae bacterium]|nr:hypothetical protein [Polyangiaceae bacterium]